jgi:hypothetical protein
MLASLLCCNFSQTTAHSFHIGVGFSFAFTFCRPSFLFGQGRWWGKLEHQFYPFLQYHLLIVCMPF